MTLRLERAVGRHAALPVAFRPGNIRAEVTDHGDGRFELRLDDAAAPDFYVVLTLLVEDDADAILRMVAEGCPNADPE